MSRITKKALQVPSQVQLTLKEHHLGVVGPLGSVDVPLGNVVKADLTDGISFSLLDEKHFGALGSVYIATRNAMGDVVKGYEASLKLIGVGFKATVKGNFLRLFIGLSHEVIIAIPSELKVKVQEDTLILINGHSREKVMAFARLVRDLKKPEPYKGKGIFLNGEITRRKEGKKK